MRTFYTDYPIAQLGDEEGKIAPVRALTILSYDGDKYCKVIVGDVITSIKLGYIYKNFGRSGEVESLKHNEIEDILDLEKGNWKRAKEALRVRLKRLMLSPTEMNDIITEVEKSFYA